MKRILPKLAFCLASLLAVSCGGGPSGPLPIAKGGFRATALVIEGQAETKFELSVNGAKQRWEGLGGDFPVLILDTAEKKAFGVNDQKKVFRTVAFESVSMFFEGHPMTPAFDPYQEAQRRGVEKFSRESDTVFAANACNLWRFDDNPEDPASPSTTFWVAPSLDRLVMKVDRETPQPDGTRRRKSTELRNVRRGADPKVFVIPESYKEDNAGK
jgi:hypothetical protein